MATIRFGQPVSVVLLLCVAALVLARERNHHGRNGIADNADVTTLEALHDSGSSSETLSEEEVIVRPYVLLQTADDRYADQSYEVNGTFSFAQGDQSKNTSPAPTNGATNHQGYSTTAKAESGPLYTSGAEYVDGVKATNAFTNCKAGWTGTRQEAEVMCNADITCKVIHDLDCDGKEWRVCSEVVKQASDGPACTMKKAELAPQYVAPSATKEEAASAAADDDRIYEEKQEKARNQAQAAEELRLNGDRPPVPAIVPPAETRLGESVKLAGGEEVPSGLFTVNGTLTTVTAVEMAAAKQKLDLLQPAAGETWANRSEAKVQSTILDVATAIVPGASAAKQNTDYPGIDTSRDWPDYQAANTTI